MAFSCPLLPFDIATDARLLIYCDRFARDDAIHSANKIAASHGHQIAWGGAVEASVHQVVVEVPNEHAGPEADVLAERIVLEANGWALQCIESRHTEI